MLIEVTTCLRQLHACGFVHRDIKPDNLLRVHRPGVAEWKLIDCGLSARAGTAVRPACTVHYAAPEVLAAHTAGAHITAAPAHDVWSLGITIFRLLDSEQARAFFELDQEKVCRRRGERVPPQRAVSTCGATCLRWQRMHVPLQHRPLNGCSCGCLSLWPYEAAYGCVIMHRRSWEPAAESVRGSEAGPAARHRFFFCACIAVPPAMCCRHRGIVARILNHADSGRIP